VEMDVVRVVKKESPSGNDLPGTIPKGKAS
jgi:hypothetical protein